MIHHADNHAETSLVSCILLDESGTILSHLTDHLTPDDFGDPLNREVFAELQGLHARSEPATAMSVAGCIMRGTQKGPERVIHLKHLLDFSPNATHWQYHAREVLEASVRRQMQTIGQTLIDSTDELETASSEAGEQLANTRERLRRFTGSGEKSPTLGQLGREALLGVSQSDDGVPTALAGLDDAIGGPLPMGSYAIVGALSGNCKTLFMMQTLVNAARAGHKCAFFSLEMSDAMIGERAVGMSTGEARTHADRCKAFDRLDSDFAHYYNITVERGTTSAWKIAERMRELNRIHGVTVFGIDYLQLVHAKADGRPQELAAASTTIKQVCTELSVVCVMGSQLSRECTKNNPPIPHEKYLAGSSEIGNGSDATFLLRWPAKDSTPDQLKQEFSNRPCEPRSLLQIRVPKLRNRVPLDGVFECCIGSNPFRLLPMSHSSSSSPTLTVTHSTG